MSDNVNQEVYLINLGNKIKSLRKDMGLSQEELASSINSNRITIVRIESGKVNSTIGMLLEIAEALRMDLGELVSTK